MTSLYRLHSPSRWRWDGSFGTSVAGRVPMGSPTSALPSPDLKNICLRVFWTLIFMASSGMFIYQMVLLFKKFKSYDVTVQTELKFEERYFPAVTICNLNPYKLTHMDAVPAMKNLIANYTAAITGEAKGADSNDTWGFGKLNDTIAIQSRARDHMMFIASEFKAANDVTRITYTQDEFIMNCAYNTKQCNKDTDFSYRSDPIYGACYTFNDISKAGEIKYKSARAGPLYGLRLLLKSNQTDYLPLTESAGVRVAVHKQGEEPFPDAFGYNAAAGFTTSFGIKFIQTERMEAPHGNCTRDESYGVFFYDSKYSVEGCFRSCFQAGQGQGLQNNIMAKETCACADPRYAVPGTSAKYCTSKDIDCVAKYSSTGSGGKDKGFNAIEECDCPQPCSESTYGVTVSTALWPSEAYQPPDCKETSTSWTDAKNCSAWFAENTMLVEVYYERMNYQLLSESEAYGLVNLISDTGGQLGLWMGISVITVVEFFSLIIILFIYCCCSKKAQEEDSDDETDTDSDTDDEKKDDDDHEEPPAYSDD